MMVPRGKMLGGSSGINYMAYVRGHPGDFDAWAAGGATGWSYDEVLPYFKKSEGLAPSGDIVDRHRRPQHRRPARRVGAGAGARRRAAVRRRRRRRRHPGAATTTAATAAGPTGVVSLLQTTTRDGKRSSTYHAFLEGEAEQRPNLEIITGAQVTRVVLPTTGRLGRLRATGVEYRTADGADRGGRGQPGGRAERRARSARRRC